MIIRHRAMTSPHVTRSPRPSPSMQQLIIGNEAWSEAANPSTVSTAGAYIHRIDSR